MRRSPLVPCTYELSFDQDIEFLVRDSGGHTIARVPCRTTFREDIEEAELIAQAIGHAMQERFGVIVS